MQTRAAHTHPAIALLLVAAALAGCGKGQQEQRAAWRDQAEAACLSSRQVQDSAYVSLSSKPITGAGTCGMNTPARVRAFSAGKVGLTSAATLACPIVSVADKWMDEVVQKAAMSNIGAQVIEMRAGSYSCRAMNNGSGTRRMSEHSYGNALDIFAFRLSDGRTVTVKDGWRGAPEEQAFLREVFVGACERFSTVLGPGHDVFHYDHLHVDLARHNGGKKICRPVIKFTPRPEGGPPPRGPEGWLGAQGPATQSPATTPGQRGTALALYADAPPVTPAMRPLQGAPLGAPLGTPMASAARPGGPIMLPGSVPVEEEVVLGDLDEQGVMDGSQRDLIEPENDPFAINAPPSPPPSARPHYSQPQPVAPSSTYAQPPVRTASPQYAPQPQAPGSYANPAPRPVPSQTPRYVQQAPTQTYGYVAPEPQPVQRPTPPGWVTGPQAAIQ